MDNSKEILESEERIKEIEKNLLASADNKTKAAKQLNIEIYSARKAMSEVVNNSGFEINDQQNLMGIVQQVNNLIARARAGEDVIEELNKINY